MKKQLTPTQMLWMFGVFALLAFILASYTFLSFRQAFRMNSEVPALPEDEITSKPTLLEHGVNVTKTGGAKVVVSEELADVLEEEARDEQSSMVGNTPIVLNTVHQPEEKVPAQPVGNVQSVKESHDKVDIVKPADNGTQNEGTLPSDENRSSKPLTSMFVQRQAPVILTANATPATSLPSPGGDGYEKFPECREYFVNSKHTELKELYEKIDSLTSLAAFYDKDETKFNLQQPKDVKYIQYNMIVWDGLINIKKAGTYNHIVLDILDILGLLQIKLCFILVIECSKIGRAHV